MVGIKTRNAVSVEDRPLKPAGLPEPIQEDEAKFTPFVSEQNEGEDLYEKLKVILSGGEDADSILEKQVVEKICNKIGDQYTTQYMDDWKTINLYHYRKLHLLGTNTKENMTDLSTLVYDLMAFKDILLEFHNVLPYKMLQDLVLISSKFYRKQSDLFWNLSELLSYVFFFEDGKTKGASEVSQMDFNFDFYSMRQLIFQYEEQKKQLARKSALIDEIKNNAESSR